MAKKKLERRDLLIDVAEMYYIKKMSQEEIAQKINLSRSNISRLLKVCIEEKIVEFKINKETSRIKELEEQVRDKYGLEFVRVVPDYDNEEVAKKEAGRALAEYISENVEDGMKIGMSWGSTMYEFVDSMESLDREVKDISVYQMLGGIGTSNVNADGPQLTKMLSEKLDAKPHIINVPLIVQSKVLRDLLLEEPQIKEHYEQMKAMDVLIMGIGSLEVRENAMYRAGYISKEEAQKVVDVKAVADLSGHSIDSKGQFCKTSLSDKVINLSLESVEAAKIKIGAAVGRKKIKPVKAVLKSDYVNAIIIDELIASELV